MIKLKQLTEKSWLVLTDGLLNIALLSEQRDNLVLIAKNAKTNFSSREEVNKFFNQNIFNHVLEESDSGIHDKIKYFINGYAVDCDSLYELSPTNKMAIDHPKMHLYTKTIKSKIYYSAGYYCLHFPKGWMPAYCPKLVTLNKYQHEGPFKSEREMKFILTKLRRES